MVRKEISLGEIVLSVAGVLTALGTFYLGWKTAESIEISRKSVQVAEESINVSRENIELSKKSIDLTRESIETSKGLFIKRDSVKWCVKSVGQQPAFG